jgi:tetratricopeptide (TPR) repeat protein
VPALVTETVPTEAFRLFYTGAVSAVDWRSEAEVAFRLVHSDPGEAARRAELTRRGAVKDGCLEAVSVSERALGLAAVHVSDLAAATRHVRTAVTMAQRAGSEQLAAEARLTLAFALMRQGRLPAALRELTAALDGLDPTNRAHGLAQRGGVRQQLGQLTEALADYQAALPMLRKQHDVVAVQRVLSNRGVLHAFRHEYRLALRDLREAAALCRQEGLTLSTAFVEENLVLVHRRLGDVPEALRHVDEAERSYHAAGAPIGSLLIERSELLLSVHLFAEAREAAQQAVAELDRTKRRMSLPEARLLLARAAVLDGDPRTGVAEAQRAVREFQRQGRSEWAALARAAVLLARLDGGGRRAPSSAGLERGADAVQAYGWKATAVELRLRAGQAALAGPGARRSRGRLLLQQVSRERSRGPADRRARGWLAAAMLRADAGDTTAALAAVDRGLRLIDDYRATMAATDLRARISGLGDELAALGLRIALDCGPPETLLAWAERARAGHLHTRPARPPVDAHIAALLARLRGLLADIDEQQRAGRATTALVRQQVRLEHQIRDATRRLSGEGATTSAACPPPAELSEVLAGARMVEFVEVGAMLHAVCVADGHVTHAELGPTRAAAELARWLPFGLARLARPSVDPARLAAADGLLGHTAGGLDRLLFDQLGTTVGDEALVIVPTGILQSIPWSLLPSLRGRPVTVAPSARLWHAAVRRQPAPGPVVVVAGPGLPGAHDEAVRIAALHPDATLLLGPAATVDAVTDALGGAALVHLAAHGTIRADNPLFSTLSFSDGPLTVYDLEPLHSGADSVVLASCDVGRNAVLAGDELLGFSAALLGRGTRQVVASVVPLPDAQTAALMVSMHRLLTHGRSFAAALAEAQEGIDRSDPARRAAAAGFVCIGAGFGGIDVDRAPPRQPVPVAAPAAAGPAGTQP